MRKMRMSLAHAFGALVVLTTFVMAGALFTMSALAVRLDDAELQRAALLFAVAGVVVLGALVTVTGRLRRQERMAAEERESHIRALERAAAEMKALNRRLEESNRDLQDFAYVASHDLQEPLRKISAFGDRLKSKHGAALPEDGRDYIDRMQSAAARMQTLIEDLLTFSRVHTKGEAFHAVDLAQVAAGVLSDLEVAIEKAGASVCVDALPSIEADQLQMRQLFQNLIGNALKFRKAGVAPAVQVRASVDTAANTCTVTVSDNGIGFEPKYAERIFTVFQRLHGRDEYQGSGVGLAVCRRIAERHGGTIRASGEPGEGATFTVTLPLRQATPEPAAELVAEAGRHAARARAVTVAA